ncbi:MAG TPA: PAS domain-containing protein [Streptosporangiaceae bacterium]|nr:PAS domain-containing protein [Streptosporangiaceae bacterium]
MSSAWPPSSVRRVSDELDWWRVAVVLVATIAILAIIGSAIIGALPGMRWTREAVWGLLAGFAVVVLVLGGVAVAAANAAARWKSAWRRSDETRGRLLQVFDGTSSVIYIKDREGRYVMVNRQCEQLFNLRREAVTGLTDYDLFPAAVADVYRAHDRKALATGGRIQEEETAPLADGTHSYITVKYPIVDHTGRPYAVCGISTDITDLKQAQEQVRRLNTELENRVHERTAELEASTQELDAFIYSVSHDLRAPLRTAGEFTKILAAEYAGQLDEKGGHYLRRVRSAIERIGNLIDGLLEMSHAARTPVDRRPIDLSELAHEVVLEIEAGHRERRVRVDIEPGLIVAADDHLLRLTLRNLLVNAWQFTAGTPDPLVQVGAAERGGRRVFFVRDNGTGFATQQSDSLFVLLERLTTVDDARGVGIRLAIAARVIARHGGRAWAESEPGRGAAIFFTLAPRPAAEGSPTVEEGWPPRDTHAMSPQSAVFSSPSEEEASTEPLRFHDY